MSTYCKVVRVAPLRVLLVVRRTAPGEVAVRIADDAAHALDVVVGELVLFIALDGDHPPARLVADGLVFPTAAYPPALRGCKAWRSRAAGCSTGRGAVIQANAPPPRTGAGGSRAALHSRPDELCVQLRMRGRPVFAMVAAGVAATAVLLAVALSVHWFPTPASTRAHDVRTLYDVLLIASVPIFVTVCVVVVTAVLRFRMRPGQEDMDGPPIHGSTLLETVWTAIPALLILSLCVYSFVVLHEIEAAPARGSPKQLDIGVVAQQFAWKFVYPPSVTGGPPLTTTTLELPIGRSVRFSMHSEDVIHSFWVPNFAAKEDVVPGITTELRATPDRLGTYPIVCAELCGIGHAFMRSSVSVVTPRAFAAWVRRRAAPVVPQSAGSRGLVAEGRAEFTGSAGCSGCHSLADARAVGTIGPNLDVGLKGKAAAFIHQCIVDPNSVAPPGYPKNVMPTTFAKTLTSTQIRALVTYLKTVAGK